AIAPVRTDTPSCMNSPRLRTMRTASPNRRARATTSAEYSPRLCPPTSAGLRPRSAHAAAAATDAVRTAGWVFAVSARTASGPSNMRRAGWKPSAAVASVEPAPPGDAPAESGAGHEGAPLHAPGHEGLLERDEDGCRTGVAVAVDVDEHALHRQAHALRGRLDDPEVGLVRDEQAHVVGGDP